MFVNSCEMTFGSNQHIFIDNFSSAKSEFSHDLDNGLGIWIADNLELGI